MAQRQLYYSSLSKTFTIFINDPSRIQWMCDQLPRSILWDLFRCSLHKYSEKKIEPQNFCYSFVNSSLTSLTLYDINFKENLQLILEILLAMKSDLISLELVDLCNFSENEEQVSECLGRLLQKCPNLINLHCCLPFDIRVLRNCKNLKYLKLCFCPKQPWHHFLEIKNGYMQPLNYLKTFSVCAYSVFGFGIRGIGYTWMSSYPNHIIELRNVLMQCPLLTAIGCSEQREKNIMYVHDHVSSNSLKEMPSSFQPRTCVWRQFLEESDEDSGDDSDDFEEPLKLVPLQMTASTYSEVKKLHLDITEVISLSSLMKLKNLTHLCISCTLESEYFHNYILPALMSMGHKLQLLCLTPVHDISINFLRKYCPNLNSFVSHCQLKVDMNEPIENFENLEFLLLELLLPNQNEQSLEVLLSKCINLKVLSLCNRHGRVLTDEFLDRLLKCNSFSKLTKASFEECLLSKIGLQKFLMHAKNLQSIIISSPKIRKSVLKPLIQEINPKVIVNAGKRISGRTGINFSFT
ncbi:uncharacterized protein CDAR_193651 [Caerostris darwini]|uniref:F-box/LRR-repeat protein n=1 Tax=Caerostris darwini TaxID=1538125 RepID=A0AAV4UDH0_9ARAC|nr:uncharacterized protein CDAR_193651 [Caerostris darwini]